MGLLYNLFIYCYSLAIQIASFFNPKAKQFIKGRKTQKVEIENLKIPNTKKIWVHCASLGEFEQARPLIEMIRRKHPESFILLTFFSPSGYSAKQSYDVVNHVTYLPLDTKSNVTWFLNHFAFDLIFIVKYEFWFNLLNEIHKRQIPTYLISGIFRPKQHFFQAYGKWFANKLKAFTHFYVQTEESIKLLQSIGFSNNTLAGDNRFDRVVEVSQANFKSKNIHSFLDGSKAVVFGSSWAKEDEFAIAFQKKHNNSKIIIAPHELNEIKIQKLTNQLSKAIRFSKTEVDQDLSHYQVLIVDTIGMLNKLYRYASIAVIGGGFGSGVHNTLEAAVYGIPIIVGPNNKKFKEIQDLIQSKATFEVKSKAEFLSLISLLLKDNELHSQSSQAAKDYVAKKAGATALIYKDIAHLF